MTVRILQGDCRKRLAELPPESVHCCVTSPPYFGLRDYGVAGQIGLEQTPEAYIAELVDVFRAVRRVLKDDGTLWLNLGDSYTTGASTAARKSDPKAVSDVSSGMRRIGTPEGLKAKDLLMIPARAALALQADGWYLRSHIIWHKPNPMPESVTDRPTSAHESIFLLSKSARYYYDAEAVKQPRRSDEDANGFRGGAYIDGRTFNNSEGGKRTATGNKKVGGDKQRGHSRRHAGFNERWDAMSRDEQMETANLRNVWTIATKPFAEAHFATFPPDLIEPCIKAGCPSGGTVLDPFGGAGTTGLVADRLGRDAILTELNPDYIAIAEKRLREDGGMFANVEVAA